MNCNNLTEVMQAGEDIRECGNISYLGLVFIVFSCVLIGAIIYLNYKELKK